MEDVEIINVIPGDKLNDFRDGFLAWCPNNEMRPDPDDPEKEIPKYTDKQWIKEWIRRDVMRAYRVGKILLKQQLAIIDEDVIT